MASDFPQDLAFLIAFWINALLHGVYIMLFIQWLSSPASREPGSRFFQVVCWLCFVAANIDAGINFYLLLEGFWFSIPNGGPLVYFANPGSWQAVFREFNYVVVVFISDAFMVFRLWRLWEGRWLIIIVPVLLLLLETAFGLIAASSLGDGNFPLLVKSINIFLGFNTSVQVIITALIGYRLLWHLDVRQLPPAQRTRRFQIVRCIVESGLLVTIGLIVDLALYAQNVLFHWVFNISLTHLYAITTVLIVLRVRNTLKAPEHVGTFSSHTDPRQNLTNMSIRPPPKQAVVDLYNGGAPMRGGSDSLEMGGYNPDMKRGIPMDVQVSREVYQNNV